MANKKQHEKFNKDVEALILKLGGTKNEGERAMYKYQINTKAGILHITTHDTYYKTDIASVYCVFDEVERAKKILYAAELTRLNPYSGKWNYHSSNNSYLLELLELNIKDII